MPYNILNLRKVGKVVYNPITRKWRGRRKKMFIVRILENSRRRSLLLATIFAVFLLFSNFAKTALALDTFPKENSWARATPSVVWCNDPNSTTTLEVHIVGRNDVARVWLTGDTYSTEENENWIELFDDGTHGDQQAGDNVFTLGDALLSCYITSWQNWGWAFRDLFIRVELINGTLMGNNYVIRIGMVDQKYKDTFDTIELAPGLSATAYAFFIEDSKNEVIDSYPVSMLGGFSEACIKLYSVMPDDFDMALVMPGMQIFFPNILFEQSPYCALVFNSVQHIGRDPRDQTALFGSAGRLMSVIYQSFAGIGVFDHEIAHTWGASIGQSLDLDNGSHWNEMTDICGQLGEYYNDSGNIGNFSYLGDETWELISNRTVIPYSPLELYIMGLIPPEEVPDIHILHSPNTDDINNITAASYETITIDDIIAAEGGERIPSVAESQKDFNLAFIVTQDIPYNDAAYAFFSLISYQLTSKDGPEKNSSLAPFYWATGGRATLETRLPVELPDPDCLPGNDDPNCIASILLPIPLAQWEFEGDADDSSANGYHGTVNGDPTYVAGMFGQAIELDGDDDYIMQDVTLPKQEGTITQWVKPNQLRQMVSYYEGAANEPYMSDNEDLLEIHISIRDTDGHWSFWYRDGEGNKGRASVMPWNSSTLAQAGVWTHVAMTWDRAGKLNVYIDGINRSTVNLTDKDFRSNTGTYHLIGRGRKVYGYNDAFPWDGAIDDVRIYDEALSTEQISTVMSGGR